MSLIEIPALACQAPLTITWKGCGSRHPETRAVSMSKRCSSETVISTSDCLSNDLHSLANQLLMLLLGSFE